MIKKLETIKLAASQREETGSLQVRRIRQQGWLPCIFYGPSQKPLPLKVNLHNFEMLLRRHGTQNLVLDLEIEGAPAKKVLLKECQTDHLKDFTLHADFYAISMTRKVRIMVAIKLLGEPVGVTQDSGVLEHLVRTVEVECLPADIVGEFQMDVSALSIGKSIFVRDIKPDAKLTILTNSDIALASVLMPHIEEEVKPEEEVAAEAVEEPEVIGEKGKKEEEEVDEEKPAEKGQGAKTEAKPKDKETKPREK